MLAQIEQRVALGQPLLKFPINGGRGRPPLRLEERGELGQRLRVDGIRLGPLEQRLGEVMGLAGVDHAHGIALLRQRGGQRDPIGTRRFQHDQRLSRRHPLRA